MSIIKEIKTNDVYDTMKMVEDDSFIINLIGYDYIEPDTIQKSLYVLCDGLQQHVKEASNGDINKFGSYSLFESNVFGKKVTVCNVFCKYSYLKNKIFLKTYAFSSALSKIYKDHDIEKAYVVCRRINILRNIVCQYLPVKTTLIVSN